jgi:hypothetical protein
MKNLITLFLLGLLATVSGQLQATPRFLEKGKDYQVVRNDDDTVIINVGKSRLVLILSSKEDRKKFKEMDLNALLQRVDGYMDAADHAKRDTTIQGKDEEYEISFVNGETRIQVRDKESKQKSQRNRNSIFYSNDRDDRNEQNHDTQKRRNRRVVIDVFNIDLGLNNFLQPGGGFPNGTDYDLQPLGSRYIAFSSNIKVPLSRSVRFKTGVEVAWFNFMFDGNRRIRNTDTGAEFFRTPEVLEKSKMTVAYASLPVMMEFGHRRNLFGFGVGGYVGYRIGSYTRVVENINGRRSNDRNHDNLSLNNLRYGLSAQARVYRVTLFFNYDLNTLFAQDRGPELNAFAFGVRI